MQPRLHGLKPYVPTSVRFYVTYVTKITNMKNNIYYIYIGW